MKDALDKCWRNDGPAKVTGRSKFSDDLKFVRLLHAVPVYSDFVHAKIVRIETADAEKAEGVLRVLTARDVPGRIASDRLSQIIESLRTTRYATMETSSRWLSPRRATWRSARRRW